MLRSVVDREAAAHGHHTDVLRHVLFTCEVVHVLLISNRVFLVSITLLLDCAELGLSESSNLSKDLGNRPILGLDGHSSKLVLHLGNDSLGPAANLVIDQCHVLFTSIQ